MNNLSAFCILPCLILLLSVDMYCVEEKQITESKDKNEMDQKVKVVQFPFDKNSGSTFASFPIDPDERTLESFTLCPELHNVTDISM